jgi:replicative DNA helicase
MVCFIHRPEYYKIYQDEKGRNMRGMAEFIVAKHRNGAVDTVILRFRNEYARFQDPEEDEYIPAPGESVTYGSSAINGQEDNGQPTAPVPPNELPPVNDADTPFGPPPSSKDVPF